MSVSNKVSYESIKGATYSTRRVTTVIPASLYCHNTKKNTTKTRSQTGTTVLNLLLG